MYPSNKEPSRKDVQQVQEVSMVNKENYSAEPIPLPEGKVTTKDLSQGAELGKAE